MAPRDSLCLLLSITPSHGIHIHQVTYHFPQIVFPEPPPSASPLHEGSPQPDRCGMTPELEDVANRWDIELEDLDTSLRCLKHYA